MMALSVNSQTKHQHRISKLLNHLQPNPTSAESEYVVSYRKKLRELKAELYAFIDGINCNPILVRLAWHDAGTYDRTIGVNRFPKCGGSNGSIRFERELSHGANAGLVKAVNYLKPFKEKYPEISWPDLIQLASVTAIEHSGGPVIPIRFGRIQTNTEYECPAEGNLPDAEPPFAGGRDPDAATHLRRVFYRMGFNDQEIVALSGAHTIGRAFKERSGTVKEGYGDNTATKYTRSNAKPRHDRRGGVGMSGGRSWSANWLTFDKNYYNEVMNDDQKLLKLSTDKIIFIDDGFRKYAQVYAKDQHAFFKDYIAAHKKLSECGSRFRPAQGFYL